MSSKSFQNFAEVVDDLMIVDALNLAFRWKHSGALEFTKDYIATVRSLAKSYKAKYVLIAADQGSSSYRKTIYPEYKQNRKDKFAEQTEEEALAFELFFEEYTRTLDAISEIYPVIRFKGCEADDIAAYIVSKKRKLPVNNIWLISSDKDWDLLVQEGVSRFSYVTRKEVTINNWDSHYDCLPEEYISIKCLMGDSGDNIHGVPGIGPKRAAELVKQYGSTWDIIASLPIQGKYKYIQALNECGDLLQLNYKLMDLVTFCQDALGDNTKEIDKVLNDYVN